MNVLILEPNFQMFSNEYDWDICKIIITKITSCYSLFPIYGFLFNLLVNVFYELMKCFKQVLQNPDGKNKDHVEKRTQ